MFFGVTRRVAVVIVVVEVTAWLLDERAQAVLVLRVVRRACDHLAMLPSLALSTPRLLLLLASLFTFLLFTLKWFVLSLLLL